MMQLNLRGQLTKDFLMAYLVNPHRDINQDFSWEKLHTEALGEADEFIQFLALNDCIAKENNNA